MNSVILMVLDKLLQKKENLQYVLFGKVFPPEIINWGHLNSNKIK